MFALGNKGLEYKPKATVMTTHYRFVSWPLCTRHDTTNCKLRRYTAWQSLTLNLLTTTIVAPPSSASKWQMGFNSAFIGLKYSPYHGLKLTDENLYEG